MRFRILSRMIWNGSVAIHCWGSMIAIALNVTLLAITLQITRLPTTLMAFSNLRSRLQPFSTAQFIIPLFATLGLIGILHHDMWRDEMNTWLIVRDSASVGEMLGYVNYQGHPALWALLVASVQQVWHHPIAMQLLHWALGTGAIAIFWLHSPFSRWQKVLFTFGYIPFYEYFLISRPYVLGMLCLFLFCAVYPTRKRTYIWVAIALGLMANSHAFAAIISLAAAITLGLEWVLDAQHRSAYLAQAKRYDLWLSFVIIGGLYGFAFVILNPPIDSANVGGRDGWNLVWESRRFFRVLGRLLGAYTLIIPNSRRWLDLILCDIVGISMAVIMGMKLMRDRTSFLFFTLATGFLLSFFYLRFMGHGTRHYAFVYLILMAALWLAQDHFGPPWYSIKTIKILGRKFSLETAYSLLLSLILSVHLVGGLYRFTLDLSVPFSAARATAVYLQKSNLNDEFMVASPDTNMAALAGYLDRQLYYPELQGLGSFTIFQQGRRIAVNQRDILRQIRTLIPTIGTCRVVLVLVEPLETELPRLDIEPLAEFTDSWHRSERMYLYWVTPTRKARCPS
ncbi:MAG: hypothetical protein F6K30_08290 [Cyanothece sp. SIO2G6]|nr:hypothetical protein [Cyanothece sp. SIO2G6]